ncbi:MAG: tRNA pseudouridine(55) synthase TruB [Deltaproteobacteria bacterium]|nr:tRNA pseudouridine(55) synthase TruB [Deltaproteobacteria bacterium]
MNGVLIVDKPKGWTSHDAVAAVKRKLGAKKVGHLGTLDPLATGVLVLVIDGATKFATSLDTGQKEYLSTLKLGEETDSYDTEGKVVFTGDYSNITAEDIKKALGTFTGKIQQVPPMYSAIKKGGTPLYKLARKGVVLEREPREVEIFSLEVTRIELPLVEFRVACSKGTYIRSICHDTGKILGCGAHLTELKRLACGDFKIEDAVTPELTGEQLREKIIPLEEALRRASLQAPQ